MAARDLASIANALAKLFYNDVTNNINRAVVLAQLLEVKTGTGQNIQWVAKFGNANEEGTAPIADGDDVSTFNRDTKVPAVLQYGTYHDAFEVTGKALAAAAAAGNPDQLVDLFGEDMNDSSQRLASTVGLHIYTGTGATDRIHGLCATAGPLSDSGTYATIERGTYAQWAANVLDALGAGPSFSLLRAMRRMIYNASGKRPDLIICDATQHEKIGLLYGADRRYVDAVRVRGEAIKLDGGYNILEFDGIPVVEDAQCPAGQILFLNTKFLFLAQLPDPATAINRSMGQVALNGTDEEQFGDGPTHLSARVVPLAINGDKYPFALYLYPQLVSRRNNVHGRIINLAG